MLTKDKVEWNNETTYKLYVGNEYLPYGIYYYMDDEVVLIEWYKTKKERRYYC